MQPLTGLGGSVYQIIKNLKSQIMSYGTVGFMNTVMMNNRKLLSQRERLKTTLGGFTPEVQEYNFPESTPQILREIRWRLREENSKRERRIMIVFSLVMIALVLGLVYLNTNYNQILELF